MKCNAFQIFRRIHTARCISIHSNVTSHIVFRTFSISRAYRQDSQLLNCNVGTIGHVDHGKTTLTAAITKYASKNGKGKFVSYEEIDRAPEERARGITINIAHVGYETKKRRYAHTDCPGHADFIKNMISGTSQMDGTIVVVAADDGQMPQTREHLLLAKQIGVERVIVYINKADLVDADMVELVEIEMRELLDEYGFNGTDTPMVVGSALLALDENQSEYGEPSIGKLLDTMDDYFTVPGRDLESPFYMPIDNVILVPGRGTVVVGTLKRGTISKKMDASLVGFDEERKTVLNGLEMFHKSVETAVAGDHVGILLKGLKAKDLRRGMVLCAEKSVPLSNYFEAQIYLLSKSEGGRERPITNRFQQTLFSSTWRCTSWVFTEDMLMPGEHGTVKLLLIHRMPVLLGDRFTLREQNARTVATGVFTKIKSVVPKFTHSDLHKLKLPG